MKFCLIGIIAFIFACSSENPMDERNELDTNNFVQCWTHSTEEDTEGNVQHFRPCDSMEFPVSRFRMTMTLRADGTATYLELSPVDAHQTVEGSWRYSEADSNFQLLNEKEATILIGSIDQLNATLLLLRR